MIFLITKRIAQLTAVCVTWQHILIALTCSLLLAIHCLSYMTSKEGRGDLCLLAINILQSLPVVSSVFLSAVWGASHLIQVRIVFVFIFSQLWNLISSLYYTTVGGEEETMLQTEYLDMSKADRVYYYYVPLVLKTLVSSLKISCAASWFAVIESELNYTGGAGKLLRCTNHIDTLFLLLLIICSSQALYGLLDFMGDHYLSAVIWADKTYGHTFKESFLHFILSLSEFLFCFIAMSYLGFFVSNIGQVIGLFSSLVKDSIWQSIFSVLKVLGRVSIASVLVSLLWIPFLLYIAQFHHAWLYAIQSILFLYSIVPIEITMRILCNELMISLFGKEAICILATAFTSQCYYIPFICMGLNRVYSDKQRIITMQELSLPLYTYFDIITKSIIPEIYSGLFSMIGASWSNISYAEMFLCVNDGLNSMPVGHMTILLIGVVYLLNTFVWVPFERLIKIKGYAV